MWIINDQYCCICRHSTSITRGSLGLNASIHLSMISYGILFYSSTMASLKELKSVILRPKYKFCSRSSQIPKSTEFKSGLLGGQSWGSNNRSCFLSFKISRVSLTVWALALSFMDKYSLCFASLPSWGIIFFNSTLQHGDIILNMQYYISMITIIHVFFFFVRNLAGVLFP